MMKPHYAFGILMLLLCTLLEVSTYPSNSESTTSTKKPTEAREKNTERSLTYDETNIESDDTTRDIIKKIIAINDALKKPNRRYPNPWNPSPPQINSENILDKDILEKLQQVIASGKLHPYSNHIQQDNNNINENRESMGYSRRISPAVLSNTVAPIPMSYVMNMPVLVMPNTNNAYGYTNNIDLTSQYQTKEGPSFSFQPFLQYLPQIQTPFASIFPILFKDPIVSAITGASLIEYGQSADVCKRQQKSERYDNELIENLEQENVGNPFLGKYREKRSVKKRTVNHQTKLQEIDKIKKLFSLSTTTVKPVKQTLNKVKTSDDETSEDLRFNFLFGQKQPITHPLNGPGFIINRLKVRKGGVAIAGPGGVATAGRGGTAIVGPGGLAYTQPGGVAVAGPAARIIALSSDADLTSVANRLQQQSSIDGSVSRLLEAIPEGKHVATGPIVYVHPNNRFYGVRQWDREGKRDRYEFTTQQDTYRYNGVNQDSPLQIDEKTFTVFVKPIAHAKSSRGMAVANPVSQVLIAKDKIGTIVHTPVATAVVGPGGIAHAQSDLYVYEYVTK